MEVNPNVAQWGRWRQVAAGCAVLAIVAAFLPWYSVFSVQGIRFDAGKITALCGVAGLGLAVAWHAGERGHASFPLVLGAVVGYAGVTNVSFVVAFFVPEDDTESRLAQCAQQIRREQFVRMRRAILPAQMNIVRICIASHFNQFGRRINWTHEQ